MPDETEHLTAAIADLKRRRREIDDAIASMERILTSVYGVTLTAFPGGDTASGDEMRRRTAVRPKRSDRAWSVISQGGADALWDAESLLEAIGEPVDEATMKAAHSILARLVSRKKVERVSTGVYRLTNASAPAATGAEETGEPVRDSPLEKGGAEDDSAASDGRDERAMDPHELHGHGDRRAAIGGLTSDVTPSVQS